VQKAYNYPNPLLGEGKTNIVFNMRSQGNVVLEIFSPFHDLLYQETYNNLPAGVNLLSWDGSKSDGSKVSSGLYICRISKKYDTGATESEIIKILIIR
jgi:flagellar hook assembly protein FlgD